jgi:hypothetical protein
LCTSFAGHLGFVWTLGSIARWSTVKNNAFVVILSLRVQLFQRRQLRPYSRFLRCGCLEMLHRLQEALKARKGLFSVSGAAPIELFDG